MKFGIVDEHQLPRPWNERSEYQLLQDALDRIELADRLDYDHAWLVEHHFLDVLAGRVGLTADNAHTFKLYAHQNEDIVRLTPEELKAKMAAKERAVG